MWATESRGQVVKFRRAEWAVRVDGIRRIEDLDLTGFREEIWW